MDVALARGGAVALRERGGRGEGEGGGGGGGGGEGRAGDGGRGGKGRGREGGREVRWKPADYSTLSYSCAGNITSEHTSISIT